MSVLTYTTTPIDRAAHLRDDEAALRTLMNDPAAQFVPVWNDLHPVAADMTPHIFGPEILTQIDTEAAVTVFLGLANGRPWFALGLHGGDAPPDLGAETFTSLRSFGALLSDEHAAAFVHGRAMAIWHINHPYCSRCGARTRVTEAGHSRTCTDESCGHRTFPRTDPAVIMLITHGDRCLLGRQAAWRAKQYSTIAGFVEPGETLEHAVRREVAEETGVNVGTVRYMASQPWPFPSSLMVGFRGEALTTEIARPTDELEDCRWFTRDEVRAADTEDADLLLPLSSSISRWLIEGWRDEV